MSTPGPYVSTPSLQSLYAVLIPFIASVLGLQDTQVVLGLANRAAMPLPGFVLVQAISRHRLATGLEIPDQTSADPTAMAIEQAVEFTVQIDAYGPNSSSWADTLTTLLRNEVGCVALAPNAAPLYADDARMAPLTDAEAQYEERWIIEATFQVNPVTSVVQQYADTLAIDVVSVTEEFG